MNLTSLAFSVGAWPARHGSRGGRGVLWSAALLVLLMAGASGLAATADDDYELYGFDDTPRSEPIGHPEWFKESFLDLPADLAEAVAAGKSGLAVYFGQPRCAYCHRLMQVNFGLPDIVEYTRRHFDVVSIDIWGQQEVTTLTGEVMTEREFAVSNQTNFTPSLLFYDREGRLALRLRGYYPPYQFRAALEYVADGHYRQESFRDYLARGDNRLVFEAGELNQASFFLPPPYQLDRSRMASGRPLAVFFEQGDCHGCDVLHGQVLRAPEILELLAGIDAVQLDMWADTPVVTPSGQRTTARRWAEDLGLFYAPTILFFDGHGREIMRVDSVAGFFRLKHVLLYISTRAYEREPDYQRWRAQTVY